VIGEKESALLVPRDAMNDGAVWVIDNAGIASLRPVTTGLAAADLVEILVGVTEGERVVAV
jgi:hypothetical protein